MNNKIKNQKVEVPAGKQFNDRDYSNSLLSTLKELEKNYSISLTEVSNECLYKKFRIMFDNISKLQRDVFELMFRKGWYEIEKADENKMTEKYQMLNNEFIKLD